MGAMKANPKIPSIFNIMGLFKKGKHICWPHCHHNHVQVEMPNMSSVGKGRDSNEVPEVCPNCGSEQLAKIKGCIRCLKCGYKGDCNGWS